MSEIHLTALGLALLEGIGLVVSPCILPILPLMLAASLDGGKARPLGIIAGFIGAFTGFALLARRLFDQLHLDPEIARNLALALLAVFGAMLLSKKIATLLLARTQKLADFGQKLTQRWEQRPGFWSGVAIGALIGLIWTPCAGPIMAAALVQVIQAKTDFEAGLTVLLFATGAGAPMLLIALAGRKIMERFAIFKTHSEALRRALGVIVIAAAALIYAGFDVQLLAANTNAPPDTPPPAITTLSGKDLLNALPRPYVAPEIADSPEWINSPSLKIAALKGQVVLVDFWTYSCVNCVRTLPTITRWDDQYRDKGLTIIGVHAPEFAFEKKFENVRKAVMKFGIHYPVVLDSDLRTWSNFSNHYWPAHYLIDKEGRVVYTHFGEGEYDVTEHNIRVLLGLEGAVAASQPSDEVPTTAQQTPETYLGHGRARNFASEESLLRDAAQNYSFPSFLPLHEWALAGPWLVTAENSVTQKAGAMLRLNFLARKVFLVLGTKDGKPATLRLTLNGKPIGKAGGADVQDGVLTVEREQLYELVDQGAVKNGLLELQADRAGLQAYAFTFGG